MKCRLMSICLEREWKTGFAANFAAPWLSLWRVTSDRDDSTIFVKNEDRYIVSLAASLKAVYSASVDESPTVFCFRDSHEMAPLANRKIEPVYDLRSGPQFPQSASV